jgi:hypothetical protein
MNAYGRIISKTPCIPSSAPDRAKRPVSTYEGPRLGKSESWFGRGGKNTAFQEIKPVNLA